MAFRANIARRLAGLIEWFIPRSVLEAGGAEYQRARLLAAYTLAVVLAAFPYAALYWCVGSPYAAFSLGVVLLLAFSLLLALRTTGATRRITNLIIGLFYIGLTALAVRLGGSHAPPLIWYGAVPLVAVSLAGRRSAIGWTALSVATMLAMIALEGAGFVFADDLSDVAHRLVHVVALMGLILLVAILAGLLEYYRERALTGVRREQAFSENVVNSLPSTFYVFDDRGRFLRWNDTFRRVSGYTDAELAAMRPWDFFEGDDRRLVSDALKRVFEAGEASAEVAFTARDGSKTPYFMTGRRVVLEDRPCVVGMGIDIAERRRAEQAMRLSEARFRTAASSVSDLVYEWDLTTGTLEWFGDIDGALGYDQGEFPKTLEAWFARIHPDDQRRLANAVEYHRVSTEPIFEEYRIQRKDGRWCHWVDRGQPVLSPAGKPMRWIGACVDVTDEKRVERELIEARQAAEAANLAKSEFLANMSHEIRTPMTAILGFADVLMDTRELHRLSPEHCEAVETIKRNGDHLLGIINDILDLSKIEAGKMTIERIRCSPCEIVTEVAALMRVRGDAKGLRLQIEYDGPIPETIETDPLRLRQILVNVIGNAVKFTEEGCVRVTCRLDDSPKTPMLCIDITDTGIGMTPEQVERLFTPFTQADTSTTRKHGGTGLGLTISKRLATMLHGDIRVTETSPGQGTRVTITVGAGDVAGISMVEDPSACAGGMTNQTPKASTVEPRRLTCRMLLAEDGPDNQRLIAHVLRKWGAEVVVVANGRLAVDEALAARDAGTPFDVILMDMQMPEMDGHQATRTLRAADYSGVIIALTAHAMAGSRERCLQAGCDDYATKPIERDVLLDTINRQIGSLSTS